MKGKIYISAWVFVDTGDNTPKEAVCEELNMNPPTIELKHEHFDLSKVRTIEFSEEVPSC